MAGTQQPTLTITNALFGSNDNPTAGTYPMANPARIQSTSGKTFMSADDKFEAPNKIKVGKDSVVCVADTRMEVPITFDTPFPVGVVPIVVTGLEVGFPNGRHISHSAVTNTGFTANVYSINAATVNFTYHAIAPDA
jgi:hypothetical protein